MQIIVPIKQILDPAGLTFRRDKERMFINRRDHIVDPGSKAAIEAALRLQDAGGGHTIIALSVGEPTANDALREALAMGCSEAYLLCDKTYASADVTVISRILAAAIDKLAGADLVIAGCASGDTGAGQVGARLAGALDYAQVCNVHRLAIAGQSCQVTRRWAQGFASLEAPLPAVITVAPVAFPPRHAHGARIMTAYRDCQVEAWNASDLGLDEPALTPLLAHRGQSFPPPLETGERFEGEPGSVGTEAIMALRMQKMVP